MRKSLEELELKNGKVVTRQDQKEFSGTIVTKYPTGAVRMETKVQKGKETGTTTYDPSGKVLSKTSSTLGTKEGAFGYEDVSNSYNRYNQSRKDNYLSNSILVFSMVGGVVLFIFIVNLFSNKKS